MGLRTCPECYNDWDGKVCTSCGHGGKVNGKGDPEPWRCAFADVDGRCRNAGTTSNSTRRNARWYCATHDPTALPPKDMLTPTPEYFKNLRASLNIRPRDREAERERDALQDPNA